MEPELLQLAGNGWRLRTQDRTRNSRMTLDDKTITTRIETSQSRATPAFILLLCQSTHRATPIIPQVVRGVWPLLRLWPYPTTPFPPPLTLTSLEQLPAGRDVLREERGVNDVARVSARPYIYLWLTKR